MRGVAADSPRWLTDASARVSRRRVPDRLVFDHVVAALVHGSGDARIATSGWSDRTIRRRRHDWAAGGLAETLHALVVAHYDCMIGVEVDDVAIDGGITKAPGGGENAGRSPVDRGKPGRNRSPLTDPTGVPLHLVSAGANHHASPLLGPTRAGLNGWGVDPAETTVDLDRGYDSRVTRTLLAGPGFPGEIARTGGPRRCRWANAGWSNAPRRG